MTRQEAISKLASDLNVEAEIARRMMNIAENELATLCDDDTAIEIIEGTFQFSDDEVYEHAVSMNS